MFSGAVPIPGWVWNDRCWCHLNGMPIKVTVRARTVSTAEVFDDDGQLLARGQITFRRVKEGPRIMRQTFFEPDPYYRLREGFELERTEIVA